MSSFYSSTLQNLIVLSQLPDAKYFPSGENVTEYTAPPWPSRVVSYFHPSVLHNFIVLSQLPDAKYFPSGENATD